MDISKYVGELKDGLPHGQGTYTWSDGDKYVGEWECGEKNGEGTMDYMECAGGVVLRLSSNIEPIWLAGLLRALRD